MLVTTELAPSVWVRGTLSVVEEFDVTQQKHLKALIRARMAKTGERYAAARRHIVEASESAVALESGVVFKAHDRHCMTAIFLPGDRELITGGFGGQARIWSLDGEQIGELVGHDSSVNAIEATTDGNRAVTASSDKTVRLWDLPARTQIAELSGHRRQVTALGIDEPNGRVWSGGHDGRIRRWDVATGEPMDTIDLGSSVTGIAVEPGGSRVAAATGASGVAIVDGASGEIAMTLDPETLSYGVRWAADGSFVMAGSADAAKVWATDEWEHVRTLRPGGPGVLPMAVSPDGSNLAIGWDHHVGVWSASSDESEVVVAGLPKGVYGLSFSRSGSMLAIAAADGRVRCYSVG